MGAAIPAPTHRGWAIVTRPLRGLIAMLDGTPNSLFGGDQGAQVAKFAIANAAHHHQMFRAAKGSELSAMLDDALRDNLTYSRKLFEFSSAGGIDV